MVKNPCKSKKGEKFFKSLKDSQKINIISSMTGIRPQHVDLSDLEFKDLDKYTCMALIDMSKMKKKR